MSNLSRTYIYKPELLHFEMQHFRNEYVCWFSGPYSTCKIKFPCVFSIDFMRNELKFGISLLLRVSLLYQTYNSRYFQMSHKRASISNVYLNHLILGTIVGFQNALRVRGVGYRFDLSFTKITVEAGYSHLLFRNLPLLNDFQALMLNKKSTLLQIKSSNLIVLNTFLSTVRNFRKPDIYKGKGIRYKKELISRKEGKKKKTA